MWKHRGLFVAISLVLVGLGLVLRLTRPRDGATPWRFAADRANSWHLTGWRRVGEQKVDWEVYFRRSPLFYRERTHHGELILTDEGCLSIFKPGRKNPHTIAIATTPRVRPPSLDSFLEWAGRETDPQSGLPRRFVWLKDRQEVAELTASYNKPLPPEALQVSLPKDTIEVDLSRTSPVPVSPPEVLVQSGALTVTGQAKQDPLGHIVVNLRYFIGGHPVHEVPALRLRATLAHNRQRQAQDESGTPYLLLRPQARALLSRPFGGGPRPASPTVDLDTADTPIRRDVKMRMIQSFYTYAEAPLGDPIRETVWLAPATKPTRAKLLTLPLSLELQYAQPLATRLKLGVAASRHLKLEVPVQRVSDLGLTGIPPLAALVAEARGRELYQSDSNSAHSLPHFAEALRHRIAWSPTDPEQTEENEKDITWLRARLAGEELRRPTSATKR